MNTIQISFEPISKKYLSNLLGETIYKKIEPYYIDMDNLVMVSKETDDYEKVNNILNEINPILQLMNEDDIYIKIYINKNVGYVLNFGDEKIIWNNN